MVNVSSVNKQIPSYSWAISNTHCSFEICSNTSLLYFFIIALLLLFDYLQCYSVKMQVKAKQIYYMMLHALNAILVDRVQVYL
ncbi:hypothetical protein XBJ1_1228 [Xenorhabdus bovienii SS-2004]|uniref:Uncharacterized protein n=1 Tax=Xenorhabdus bovienii (strain SS-2004) TaxID=406818 RepID=D3UXI6_XENBS|nr:hypothetical protein XBJ1_1228 [Xenorhabdus bovienii SS-2004]